MKKRHLLGLTVLCCVFFLCACGNSDSSRELTDSSVSTSPAVSTSSDLASNTDLAQAEIKNDALMSDYVPVRLLKSDGSSVYSYLNRSELVEYINAGIDTRHLEYDKVTAKVSRMIEADFIYAAPFFENGLAAVTVESGKDAKTKRLIDRSGNIVSGDKEYVHIEALDGEYVVGEYYESDVLKVALIDANGAVVEVFRDMDDLEDRREREPQVSAPMRGNYFYTKYLGNGYFYGAQYEEEFHNMPVEYLREAGIKGKDWEYGFKKALIKDGEQIGGFDYQTLRFIKDDLFYVGDGEHNYFYDFKLKSKMYNGVDVGDLSDFHCYNGLMTARSLSDAQVFITASNVYFNDVVQPIHGGYIYRDVVGNPLCYMISPSLLLEDKMAEQSVNALLDDHVSREFAFCPVGESKFRVFYIDNVVNVTEDILTVDYHYYKYSFMAAHPMHSREFRVYDLSEGKQIRFEDWFTDFEGAKKVVLEELTSRYREEIGTMDTLEENGPEVFFELNRMTDHVCFRKGEMYIVYSPYEIASYARGYVEMRIDLKKLQPFMKERYYKIFAE
ncbi:MAG: hypothetical protein Q4A41_04665 [Bacillota bacterium]|nr:hypothetical protein [Bacillota bacterium]